MQQFLLPDQTPPILEAEMALRAEQLVNGERGRHAAPAERKTCSPRRILTPDTKDQKDDSEANSLEVSGQKQELSDSPSGSIPGKSPEAPAEKEKPKEYLKTQQEVKGVKEEEVKDVRQEPKGQLADNTKTEKPKKPVVSCVLSHSLKRMPLEYKCIFHFFPFLIHPSIL